VSLAIEVLKEGDWLRALLAKKEGRAGALAEAFSAGKEQVYQQQTEQQEASCTQLRKKVVQAVRCTNRRTELSQAKQVDSGTDSSQFVQAV
jgi:hypothetical protein